MAKKRLAVQPDCSEDVDTGIYRRNRIFLKRSNPSGIRALHEAITTKRPLVSEWTASLEAELNEVARAGDQCLKRDARRAIMHLQVAIQIVDRLDNALAAKLLDEAMMLGEVLDRINVRSFERAAWIGREKIRKSQLNARETNKKRAAKRPDYSAAVAALMAKGMKYDPACREVAGTYDTTKETVRNNTPELRPRRPKMN
jgi:hypothetical protein